MIGAALVLAVLVLAPGDDLAPLEKKLRSSDDRERQAAVQELGKLGTKESWSLVLDALKDVSSRVADEAEIQLAKVKDPLVVKELCGKRGILAKDAWVATHAAGALGRLEIEVSLSALPETTSSMQQEARSTYYAALERLARGAHLAPATTSTLGERLRSAKTVENQSEDLAARLLAAVAMQAGYENRFLASVEGNPPVAMWCALASIERDPGSMIAQNFVKAASVHPARAVRAALVDSLARTPKLADLDVLVAMLEKETNDRLRWTIDARLERLTGIPGGAKPEFWRQWLANAGPEWKPVTGDPQVPTPVDSDATRATLMGMPILSSRLAILVDFSGSTWDKRADGKTRKERLDLELAATLAKLPASTKFNVVPYTNDPIPWEKSLVAATPANVKKALDFFTGCKANGKGNFWDAAMLAISDEEVDTILVLTDGAPTGGHRWNLDLMRERFQEKNRFHQVVLDAVLVDAKKGLQDRWRAWCTATGGRMIAVDV